MKKNRATKSTIMMITTLSIITLLLVSLTVAFLTDTRSTLNFLRIGVDGNNHKLIQIALLEEAFAASENAEAIPYQNGIEGEYEKVTLNNLLPGDQINKDSTVKNIGKEDVYIRVKLLDSEGREPVDSDFIPTKYLDYQLGDSWVYNSATGYYYYADVVASLFGIAKVLTVDETAPIFTTFGDSTPYTMTISSDLSNTDLEGLEGLIDINVIVEAIQAKNFSPRVAYMHGEDPWYGETAQAVSNRWSSNY